MSSTIVTAAPASNLPPKSLNSVGRSAFQYKRDSGDDDDNCYPRKESASSAAAVTAAARCADKKCTVCGRLAFRGRRIVCSLMAEQEGGWDFVVQDGLYEFLHHHRPEHADGPGSAAASGGGGAGTDALETEVANKIADRVQRCVKRMQKDLAAAGLVGNGVSTAALGGGVEYRHHQRGGVVPSYRRGSSTTGSSGLSRRRESSRRTSNSSNGSSRSVGKSTPMMAPYSSNEISLGPVLGTGGFSVVFEIVAFRPNQKLTSADFHPCETAARYFLAEHAQREDKDGKDSNGHDETAGAAAGSAGDETSVSTEQRQQQHQEQEDVPKQQEQRNGKRTVARYALKHLRRHVARDEDKFQKAAIDLAMEAQLLLILDHPNIIRIRGWSRHGTDALRSGRHSDFFLIMDRLPETMEDRLYHWRQQIRKYRQRGRLFPWCRAKYLDKIHSLFLERLRAAFDVATAVEYLHERRIMQRDIKISNIGFDIRGDLKLFDFGLARLLPPQGQRLHDGYEMSRVGTKYYMAPEIRNKESYDISADVYSFGVVLWEILSLCTPREVYLRNTNKKKEKKKSRRVAGEDGSRKTSMSMPFTENNDDCWLPICPCWPDAIQNTVRRCLAEDPNRRPSISEVRLILYQQMQDLGMPQDAGKETKRRRSTFRLDLSQLDFGSVRLASRTSHTSSIGLESSSLSLDLHSSVRGGGSRRR